MRGLVVAGEGGRRLLEVDALELEGGALLSITGPSGAGKSTLLGALAGLRPTGGRVAGSARWTGAGTDLDVATASAEACRRFRAARVGFVFQEPRLFDELGALDNAAIGAGWRPAAERARVREAAAERLVALGLDPEDPRPVARLSGGERQRVGLARALATDPVVVLADEPTASLDREAGASLIGALRALADNGGRTLLVASHDPALHAVADRTVRVVDGTLDDVPVGSPADRPAADRAGGAAGRAG